MTRDPLSGEAVMRRWLFAVAVVGLTFERGILFGGEEGQGHAERRLQRVAHDYQLLSPVVARTFHPFRSDAATWPDPERVTARRMGLSPSVRQAIHSTVLWTRTVLQPQWAPRGATLTWAKRHFFGEKAPAEGPEFGMIALRKELWECDAVRLRYQTDGHFIQVAATAWTLVVLIQKDHGAPPDRPLTEDEASRYVSGKIDEFLNEGDKIKRYCMGKITKVTVGVEGSEDPLRRGPSIWWWGNVGWWTDGHTVMFLLGKCDGGPYMPTLQRRWFSDEPGPRRAARAAPTRPRPETWEWAGVSPDPRLVDVIPPLLSDHVRAACRSRFAKTPAHP